MINIENKSQEGNVKEKKDHNEYSLISLIVDSIAVPLVSNPNPNPNYNERSKLVYFTVACFGPIKQKYALFHSLLIFSALNPIFAKFCSVIKGPIVRYISHILARGVFPKD